MKAHENNSSIDIIKKMTLFVTIAPCYQLNLSSDYFAVAGILFKDNYEIQVNLVNNPLSRLIEKDMAYELKMENSVLYRGKVSKVVRRNGNIAVILSSSLPK